MAEIYDDDDRRLTAAVQLGIITDDQAARIRALVPDRPRRRVPGPIDASILGYVLGAITVLVAMAWFLADRWEWLGAEGVLAVVVIYALLFLFVARRLRRDGHVVAGGLAVTLAVGMVPLAVISLNEITQWLVVPTARVCWNGAFDALVPFEFWRCRGLELATELATVAAALIAIRAIRFPLLALPVAAIGLRGVFHVTDAVSGTPTGTLSAVWVWIIATSVAVAIAYAVDRTQPEDEDYAAWLHLVAAVAALISTASTLNAYEEFRQLLVPAAFVAFTFALRMRRFVWTFVGLVWFVVYLGWLASDVFRDTPFFPIVLAALGLALIIATVWVQRNAERLAARFGGLAADGRPAFPGGVALLLMPALVTMLQLPAAFEADAAVRREVRATGRALQARARARGDSLRVIRVLPDSAPTPRAPQETTPAPRP